jgi:hypothetical protein
MYNFIYFALLIPEISAAQVLILDWGFSRGLATDNFHKNVRLYLLNLFLAS